MKKSNTTWPFHQSPPDPKFAVSSEGELLCESGQFVDTEKLLHRMSVKELKQECQKLNSKITEFISLFVKKWETLLQSSKKDQKFLTADAIDNKVAEWVKSSFLWQGLPPANQQYVIQAMAFMMEQNIQKQVKNATDHRLTRDVRTLNLEEKLDSLNKAVTHTIKSTENVDITALYNPPNTQHEQYKKDIQNIPKEILKSKYKRHELGFLGDKDLTQPTEVPYIFQSPEPLQKIKELYLELYQVNPYHLQGRQARLCGMSALELADQMNIRGEFTGFITLSHPWVEDVGHGFKKIVDGDLPLGWIQSLYEFCTGETIFTAEKISDTAPLVSNIISHFSTQGSAFDKHAMTSLLINTRTQYQSRINNNPLSEGGDPNR